MIAQETEAVAKAALASIGAWEAREARPIVKGVCIDSDHSLDRDDAIWFEETADGKLIVDVTIADVAAFISKDSFLDKRARNIAETEYGANSVLKPMFPFRLSQDDGVEGNGIFSLSDKSMRAGITTRITINQTTGLLENVEVFPSLILPEIANYEQVASDISENPNGRFAKWAKYTATLKKIRNSNGESIVPISMLNEADGMLTNISEEGLIEKIPENKSAASKMVEETALLANRSNARFFAAANLPYLFRIHNIKLETEANFNKEYESISEAMDARQALQKTSNDGVKLVLDRASYASRRRKHAALGEYAYSHSTSPIRRYADIPNQRMQHWLAQTVAELSHLINEEIPEISIDEISQYIGKLREKPEHDLPPNGAKLIGWIGRLHLGERESSRKFCREKIHKYMVGTLRDISPNKPLQDIVAIASNITDKLNSRINPPPYTQIAMEEIAIDINATLAKTSLSERDKLAQKLMLTEIERKLEMAELQVLDALEINDHAKRSVAISEFSAEKRFPLALHMAASQNREYRIAASEILQRMENGRLREPADLATILVQTKIPKLEDAADDTAFSDEKSKKWLEQNIEDWVQLKETILSRFAANPSFTKGFLKHLEDRYDWQIHSTHASLIADGAIAATMSLNPNRNSSPEAAAEHSLFPNSFSIGHWGKTTRHHARLELLRGLAYNNLKPASAVKLPRTLKLMTCAGFNELASQDSNSLINLKKKATETGINIKEQWNEKDKNYSILASTDTEKLEPIEFVANANNKETAEVLAWQALLRSKMMRSVHEKIFRQREKLSAIPIDADAAIKWISDNTDTISQNIHLSSTSQRTQRREPIWQAKLTLQLANNTTRQFIGESTQKEVAETFANEAGLRYLRERADYGDSKVEEALHQYEKGVTERYAQNGELSSKVPYAANIFGRDIKPVENNIKSFRAR